MKFLYTGDLQEGTRCSESSHLCTGWLMKYTGVLEVSSVKSLFKLCPYKPNLSHSPFLADLYLQLPCSPVPSFPTHNLWSVLPDTVPTSLKVILLTEGKGNTQHILKKTVLGKDKQNLWRCSVRWLQIDFIFFSSLFPLSPVIFWKRYRRKLGFAPLCSGDVSCTYFSFFSHFK